MMQYLLIFAIVPGISPRPAVGPQTWSIAVYTPVYT